MQAVRKTIEALRGIARWGTGDMMEAAFTGFEALPAPTSWRKTLGVESGASAEEVRAQYMRLRSEHHRNNNIDAFHEVEGAYDQARRELGL